MVSFQNTPFLKVAVTVLALEPPVPVEPPFPALPPAEPRLPLVPPLVAPPAALPSPEPDCLPAGAVPAMPPETGCPPEADVPAVPVRPPDAFVAPPVTPVAPKPLL